MFSGCKLFAVHVREEIRNVLTTKSKLHLVLIKCFLCSIFVSNVLVKATDYIIFFFDSIQIVDTHLRRFIFADIAIFADILDNYPKTSLYEICLNFLSEKINPRKNSLEVAI